MTKRLETMKITTEINKGLRDYKSVKMYEAKERPKNEIVVEPSPQ